MMNKEQIKNQIDFKETRLNNFAIWNQHYKENIITKLRSNIHLQYKNIILYSSYLSIKGEKNTRIIKNPINRLIDTIKLNTTYVLIPLRRNRHTAYKLE